jgi:hypothetical protein
VATKSTQPTKPLAIDQFTLGYIRDTINHLSALPTNVGIADGQSIALVNYDDDGEEEDLGSVSFDYQNGVWSFTAATV